MGRSVIGWNVGENKLQNNWYCRKKGVVIGWVMKYRFYGYPATQLYEYWSIQFQELLNLLNCQIIRWSAIFKCTKSVGNDGEEQWVDWIFKVIGVQLDLTSRLESVHKAVYLPVLSVGVLTGSTQGILGGKWIIFLFTCFYFRTTFELCSYIFQITPLWHRCILWMRK